MGHSTVFVIGHQLPDVAKRECYQKTYCFLSLLPVLPLGLSRFFATVPAVLLLTLICHEEDVEFSRSASLIKRNHSSLDVPESSCAA